MMRNPFYTNIFIDSCAFDPKYEPESSASEEILKLSENNEINLVISHSTMKETQHPNTPVHVKEQAISKIYTIKTNLVDEELNKKQEIWDILTGDGKPENMEQDANHVFEAHKYGGYFITSDARILKKKENLEQVSSAIIFLPSEFLKLLKKHKCPTKFKKLNRTLVSEKELTDWLNEQLHVNQEYKNCKFTPVYRVEVDHEGVNWSPHFLRCSGIPSNFCNEQANKITLMARKKFNLK